jgi:Holliday junction DNA helicase RuvA
MIEYLKGKIIDWQATKLVIDVSGIGYGINVTVPCAASAKLNEDVGLFTYLAVKEDSLTLFGFLGLLEKNIFLELISVNGVGPKMGQRILSEVKPQTLVDLICTENVDGLVKLKGVGKKTAELLVLQLKTKLSKWAVESGVEMLSPVGSEATQALISLGLKDVAARKAVEKALKGLGEGVEVAELITEALRHS